MLNPDFREFIESLNANKVRYLVIGGYAVAFHGHPRYTKDLDVWIDASLPNGERVLQALRDFGFSDALGLQASDFALPDQIIQLGYPPRRIDLLTEAKALQFEQCWGKRVTEEIEGQPVHFLDLDSLRTNKQAVGRTQDLADLENLQ